MTTLSVLFTSRTPIGDLKEGGEGGEGEERRGEERRSSDRVEGEMAGESGGRRK